MSGDEVQRLLHLEQENTRLKRALADAMLDNEILNTKKIVEHPRYGHRRVALKLEETLKRPVSGRNVQRIMQSKRLQIRTRRRKKWVKREPVATLAITRPDEV
jgi:hypothetical protein